MLHFLHSKNWNFEFKELFLRDDWTISRNSSKSKINLFIKFNLTQNTSFWGEAAPNIRYDESPETLQAEIQKFIHVLDSNSWSESSEIAVQELLIQLFSVHFSNCFRFAVSSILYELDRSNLKKSFEQYYGINESSSAFTSYSIPILAPEKLKDYFKRNNLHQYKTLKLKIKDHHNRELLTQLTKLFKGKIRVDANEGFQRAEDFFLFISKLEQSKTLKHIEFIEQPFPAKNFELYYAIKSKSPVDIILDESIESQEIAPVLKDLCDGINIKLMKSSSIICAIKQIKAAKGLGLKTMLGCMIESSLGISFALRISGLVDYCDLDGHLLLRADPFGHLLSQKQDQISF